ncbi:ABC transporter ATP-binding protein [uncultured Helicobacter sp.]|uniref:ABC transporter ATP-binding protein n=1 Tax=uncultured Helicobacter sp. TaxID=175537 RepID=UPI00374F2132
MRQCISQMMRAWLHTSDTQTCDSKECNKITIKNLSVCADNALLLDSIELTLTRGSITALLGASGSGKSLTMRALSTSLPSNLTQTSGEIFLDGHPISHAPTALFSHILQNPQSYFNPLFSINSHCRETLKALHKPYDHTRIHRVFEQSGFESHEIESVLKAYPFMLSGGMLQRAMIAIALLRETPFLLADEPTSNLDAHTQEEILTTLLSLVDSHCIGVLLITHDIAVAMRMASRFYHISKGRVRAMDRDEIILPPSSPQRTPPKLTSTPMLYAHNLCYSYTHHIARAHTAVLHNINLALHQGIHTAIIGPSGCGKSTLAKILSRLLTPQSGELTLDSKPLHAFGREFYTQVQILLQDSLSSLNPSLCVFDNLIEPLIYLLNIRDETTQHHLIDPILERVHLPHSILSAYPAMLSGGELQRVCLLRALLVSPRILILDESLSGLDFALQIEIVEFLQTLESTTIICITHDISLARRLCGQFVFLDRLHT